MKNAKAICLITIIIFTFVSVVPCLAYEKESEHNKRIENVLFGPSGPRKNDELVKCIEKATAFTIDQCNGTGENKIEYLNSHNMKGIPDFIDVDYAQTFGNVNASNHRKYTHDGWDRSFEGSKEQKFWENRRKIMLGTVNTVFGFQTFTIFGYNDKCNAVCGIVYYAHILGDYDQYSDPNDYRKVNSMVKLTGEEEYGTDMIASLRSYTEILFLDQQNTYDYKQLMAAFDKIERKAKRIDNSYGGLNSSNKFMKYQKYIRQLLELMERHMPKLFEKEEFFNKIF